MFKKIIVISVVIISIFFTTHVFAQTKTITDGNILNIWKNTGDGEGTCNMRGYTCTFCDGIIIATNIIKLLIILGIALSTILILYGAIRLMLSGGSEKHLSNAKNIIVKALIGLAIIGGGWLIVDTIFKTFVKNSDWDKIEFLGCGSGKIDFKNRNTEKSWAGGTIPQGNPNLIELNEENTNISDNGICYVNTQTSLKNRFINSLIREKAFAGNAGTRVINKASQYIGKLEYNNADNRRTLIDGEKDGNGNYIINPSADCSGFTWKIYQCALGTDIPKNTTDLGKFRGNSDLGKIDVKDLTNVEISQILGEGDLLGFNADCRNQWWDKFDPQKEDRRRPQENPGKRWKMGHVMIYYGLSNQDVPMILHQTGREDGTFGVYSEEMTDVYWGPWRECGYIIHIRL